MKPKVTIGVCVKNAEATIRDAVESILVQDFPHELMEAIFVDDGSDDKTFSILNMYIPKMDMQVKVFHQKWKGLGPSRNKVVDNANGEYIVWLDGDMILPADHVKKQVEFMDTHPDVGIGKARYEMRDEKNIIAFLESLPFVVATLNTQFQYFKLPGTGGSIFNIKAIRQVDGFDNSLKGVGEDQDVAYRIALEGWKIRLSNASFFEKRENTWNSLWKKYDWYGYGNYELHRKNRKIIKIYKMIPPAGFLAGLFYSFSAYRLTGYKAVFLLPLHFVFKSVAWCWGFIKAAFVRTFS
jgi:glycosyltransferase involved in cell wall biosynthesis